MSTVFTCMWVLSIYARSYLHIKVICGFPMNTTSTILFNREGKKSDNTV